MTYFSHLLVLYVGKREPRNRQLYINDGVTLPCQSYDASKSINTKLLAACAVPMHGWVYLPVQCYTTVIYMLPEFGFYHITSYDVRQMTSLRNKNTGMGIFLSAKTVLSQVNLIIEVRILGYQIKFQTFDILGYSRISCPANSKVYVKKKLIKIPHNLKSSRSMSTESRQIVLEIMPVAEAKGPLEIP